MKITEEQIAANGLEIRSAGPGQLVFTLHTPGRVKIDSDKHIHVLPEVHGYVAEVHKGSGDSVKTGDLLAVLESQEMAEAAANYLATFAKERLAATLLQQEAGLAEKKITAEQEHLTAKAAYEQSRIDLKLARYKLQSFGLSDKDIANLIADDNPNLLRYEIHSPMDGIVVSRNLVRGTVVEPTATIFQVADLSEVLVEIAVFPKDLYTLKKGQKATVEIPLKALKAEGEVTFISPMIADFCITATGIIAINNRDGLWRPGTVAQVKVRLQDTLVPVLIPNSALQNIQGEQVVFVKSPDGFEKRVVKIGQSDGHATEILKGLEPGELYAAGQTFLLKAELGKDSVEDD